jgi:hypothetical protein
MANSNRPVGLAPVKHLNGAPWNQAVTTYVILAADTAVYGIGDIVKTFAGGTSAASGVNPMGVPAVTKAAAGELGRGVIVGVQMDIDDFAVEAIPSTKGRDYYVFVVDDPSVVYSVQANNSTTFPTADLNANANIVVAVPSGISPFSGSMLDAASTATTSTLQLKILGMDPFPGNDLSANTKLLVTLNASDLTGLTTAVAA